MIKKVILCLLIFFMFSPIVAQTKWDKENSFKVQNKLLELGFDPKGVDGVWGNILLLTSLLKRAFLVAKLFILSSKLSSPTLYYPI